MRKTLLMAVMATLFTTLAFTQGSKTPTTIQFFTQDGTQFSVWVNGMQQNMQPTTRYTLTNLTSNGYLVKIEFAGDNVGAPLERHFPVDFYTDYVWELRQEENSEIEKSAAGLRNEMKGLFGGKVTQEEEEQTFRNIKWDFYLVSENHREDIRGYSGATNPGTTSSTTTTSNPDNFSNGNGGGSGSVNNTMTTSGTTSTGTTSTTTTSTTSDVSSSGGGNGGGGSVSISMSVNDGMGGSDVDMSSNTSYEETTTVTTTTTTSTSDGMGTGEVILTEPSGCYPMNDYDFDDARGSISSKTFSDSKMKIAKQVTSNNCLTALQIKQVVELFDFESDRLHYAKYAYDYSYDPNNYYKVNDAFEFESTIEELDEYINSRR